MRIKDLISKLQDLQREAEKKGYDNPTVWACNPENTGYYYIGGENPEDFMFLEEGEHNKLFPPNEDAFEPMIVFSIIK